MTNYTIPPYPHETDTREIRTPNRPQFAGGGYVCFGGWRVHVRLMLTIMTCAVHVVHNSICRICDAFIFYMHELHKNLLEPVVWFVILGDDRHLLHEPISTG